MFAHNGEFICIFGPKINVFLADNETSGVIDNEKYPLLIFPAAPLRLRESGGVVEVFVPTRGGWLELTPEEWVRRHVVEHLCCHLCVPPTHISEEYPVPLNGQNQRADIVAFGPDMKPWIVVECKAPTVTLSDDVVAQVVRYNSVIGAPYVVVTNGLEERSYVRTDRGYTPCEFLL